MGAEASCSSQRRDSLSLALRVLGKAQVGGTHVRNGILGRGKKVRQISGDRMNQVSPRMKTSTVGTSVAKAGAAPESNSEEPFVGGKTLDFAPCMRGQMDFSVHSVTVSFAYGKINLESPRGLV